MTLPDDANTVTGGCSCGAIRYRVAIPALQSRPLHPMSPPEAGVRLPQTITCHCNDCRRATGSFLAISIVDIPGQMLTVSAMSSSSESAIVSGRILDALADGYDQTRADAERPPYVPAMDVLRATGENTTWLRFFHSTDCGPALSRSFCGRCGSPLCFHLQLQPDFCDGGKVPEGTSDLFHIYLGSVDRKFLELDWFVPGAEVNFKHGTPFSKKVSATAAGLKGVLKMFEFSPESGIPDADELKKLGE